MLYDFWIWTMHISYWYFLSFENLYVYIKNYLRCICCHQFSCRSAIHYMPIIIVFFRGWLFDAADAGIVLNPWFCSQIKFINILCVGTLVSICLFIEVLKQQKHTCSTICIAIYWNDEDTSIRFGVLFFGHYPHLCGTLPLQ